MGFPTLDDYDHFIRVLDEKVRSNDMQFNSSLENTTTILGIDFRTYVICNACGENWALEIPDHANRGYFLNQQGIEIYYSNREKQNRRVKRNGLILLVIIVILLIFKCS